MEHDVDEQPLQALEDPVDGVNLSPTENATLASCRRHPDFPHSGQVMTSDGFRTNSSNSVPQSGHT